MTRSVPAGVVAQAGVMTVEDADAWADSLFKDTAEEVFFGASNYYSYVAKRPEGAAA